MTRPPDRGQALAFAGVALAAVALVALQLPTAGPDFARFLGRLPPIAVFVATLTAAGVAFATVLSPAGFRVIGAGAAAWAQAAGCAGLFGLIVVIADRLIVFPAGMNIPFPRSLAFYPAIGVLAEALFHLLPLALTLALLRLTPVPRTRAIPLALAVALVPEPVFQALAMAADGYGPWPTAFVAIHLLAINAVGLWLFRRHDFLTMLGFRLLYYVIWHIAWGHLRLGILF